MSEKKHKKFTEEDHAFTPENITRYERDLGNEVKLFIYHSKKNKFKPRALRCGPVINITINCK